MGREGLGPCTGATVEEGVQQGGKGRGFPVDSLVSWGGGQHPVHRWRGAQPCTDMVSGLGWEPRLWTDRQTVRQIWTDTK